MTFNEPYPAELKRIARRVVWYDTPEEPLRDLKTFLAHLMVYGAPVDVAWWNATYRNPSCERCSKMPPAGVFAAEAWARWHERFRFVPIPPLPRGRFPDGSLGPEPDLFFGHYVGTSSSTPTRSIGGCPDNCAREWANPPRFAGCVGEPSQSSAA